MSDLAASLRSDAVQPRLDAIRVLATGERQADADDLRALVACLGFPGKAVQRRAAEACAALAVDPSLRSLLTEAVRADDAALRWGAAYALARTEGDAPEALPAAIEAMGSADGDVRWAAAEIVKRLARRWPDVIGEILRVAGSDPPERRKMALYCLRDLEAAGDEARRAALLALDDADEGVVLAALSTLARRAPSDEDAVAGTLRLLESGGERVRRAAAAALSHLGLGLREVEEALRRAADVAGDESLRRAAARALKERRVPP